MKYKYDFHIHTALSPCADDDMTPNNIINMAMLNKLDFIAVTDHNTCKNAKAVIKAADGKDILVIPGLEVETLEACHILCLFSRLEDAERVEAKILQNLPYIKNNRDVYGNQLVLDEDDCVKEEFDILLLNSSNISVFELFEFTIENGGIPIPAHVDRDSYSIVSNLGSIPMELNTRLIEISQCCDEENFVKCNKEYLNYKLLKSSDAHFLWQIGSNNSFMELDEKSVSSLFKFFYNILKQK